MLCYVCDILLCHNMNEIKNYVCHVMLCHVKSCYRLYEDRIWKSWWLLCIRNSHVCYDMDERKSEMILCFDFNLWEPHAFMFVMYIRILSRYVMLVRMCTFYIRRYRSAICIKPIVTTRNFLLNLRSLLYTYHKHWMRKTSLKFHKT